jgi:hypothetical protein
MNHTAAPQKPASPSVCWPLHGTFCSSTVLKALEKAVHIMAHAGSELSAAHRAWWTASEPPRTPTPRLHGCQVVGVPCFQHEQDTELDPHLLDVDCANASIGSACCNEVAVQGGEGKGVCGRQPAISALMRQSAEAIAAGPSGTTARTNTTSQWAPRLSLCQPYGCCRDTRISGLNRCWFHLRD